MNYKDIVKWSYDNNPDEKKMWGSVRRISDLFEELKKDPSHKKAIEDFLMTEKIEMSGGHYNEGMAYKVVDLMRPILLMKDDKIVTYESLNDYMGDMGLEPRTVYDAVKAKEKEVVETFAAKGMKAPLIPEDYTAFDFYVCMAEKLDHNWNTINGDMSKGALLVYEALSDHDGGTRKVWDNTKHYLE